MANNHNISLNEAVAMTQRYRENKDAILAAGVDKNILALAETFDREIIDSILSTPGCASFRIYYGMSEDLFIHAILVAVDASGKDILPSGDSKVNASDPPIGETGQRCPPVCSSSPLNP